MESLRTSGPASSVPRTEWMTCRDPRSLLSWVWLHSSAVQLAVLCGFWSSFWSGCLSRRSFTDKGEIFSSSVRACSAKRARWIGRGGSTASCSRCTTPTQRKTASSMGWNQCCSAAPPVDR